MTRLLYNTTGSTSRGVRDVFKEIGLAMFDRSDAGRRISSVRSDRNLPKSSGRLRRGWCQLSGQEFYLFPINQNGHSERIHAIKKNSIQIRTVEK
jgi:hypothetical protein